MVIRVVIHSCGGHSGMRHQWLNQTSHATSRECQLTAKRSGFGLLWNVWMQVYDLNTVLRGYSTVHARCRNSMQCCDPSPAAVEQLPRKCIFLCSALIRISRSSLMSTNSSRQDSPPQILWRWTGTRTVRADRYSTGRRCYRILKVPLDC